MWCHTVGQDCQKCKEMADTSGPLGDEQQKRVEKEQVQNLA